MKDFNPSLKVIFTGGKGEAEKAGLRAMKVSLFVTLMSARSVYLLE